MTRHLLPLIAVALLVAASGCTSTNVVSNRAEDFAGPVDAVVVLTQFGSSMETFEETFGSELSRLLQARGVRVEVIRTGGLELNPADPVAAATEIGSSLIFLVGQTESQTFSDGGFMNDRIYTFDASLVEIDTRRRVWRAEVKSKVGTYSGAVAGANKMAEKVVEKLVEDALLPAPVAEST